MAQPGSGGYPYEPVRDWPQIPAGEKMGVVSRVTTDSQDRVSVFQRKDPLVLGTRSVHSDTGNVKSPWLAERAGGPFNHPTEMMPHPSGDIYAGLTVDHSVDKFVRVR